ncbi:MAG: 50S ribosomal protein L4 [Bacteroidota bacterium]
MELTVYNINGNKADRSVVLNEKVFGIEPNDHVIYLDVKQFLANQRQGTHSTLEKSTISGSTRKLKKQKGTGGARAGSIKSPLFKGGARVFGPHPRDYSFKLNKKVKRLARISALTYKAKEENIIVLEKFSFEKPSTQSYFQILNNFDLAQKKTILVVSELNKNVYLSTRNLKQVKIIKALNLNTYDILNAKKILIVEDSLKDFDLLID